MGVTTMITGSLCLCGQRGPSAPAPTVTTTPTGVSNINSTHNYLYCEYVTGMITYFDLRVDPFQLRNLLYTLPSSDLTYMHDQVTRLKNYSGKRNFLKVKQKQWMNQRRTRYMRKRKNLV